MQTLLVQVNVRHVSPFVELAIYYIILWVRLAAIPDSRVAPESEELYLSAHSH